VANPLLRGVVKKITTPKRVIKKTPKKYKNISYIKFKTFKHNRFATQSTKRRITNLEKNLLTSKYAKKTRFNGRTVVKRNIFECSQMNISRMLKGNAPLDRYNHKPVNLHHLKQQQMGSLVELTQYEHNTHSKVLHRYVTTSEITDRNNGFQKFRTQWWKKRALECKIH
jgi:hypothetical protein